MSNALDLLCAMLDERGVKWREHLRIVPGSMARQREILWGQPVDQNKKPLRGLYFYRATDMGDGRLYLEAQLTTPEKAIAATLGPRTCRKLPSSGETRCFVSRYGCEKEFGYWKCSNCGAECFEGAKYCMSCGAKVVDE